MKILSIEGVRAGSGLSIYSGDALLNSPWGKGYQDRAMGGFCAPREDPGVQDLPGL